MAKVVAVNVSEKKGTIKHAVEEVEMKEDFGIVGDSHAEQGSIRQISLLGIESINKMKEYGIGLCVGKFAENVTTEGICLYELPVGTKLKIGETLHEVTQIGKKCHALRRHWFGLFPVRSPLLGESFIYFLFLQVLRCFSSLR